MTARPIRVGVQLQPQHTTVGELRALWRTAEETGVDSLWIWDHFFPLWGGVDGSHFEAWTLLAAMAGDTSVPTVGPLVSCTAYRSPDLLADMARTIDHLSGGRLVLGLGAGWWPRDHVEYGVEFPPPAERVGRFEAAVERLLRRSAQLVPPPCGPFPLLIGGSSDPMLRIAATHAAMWNCTRAPEDFAELSARLSVACEGAGRCPSDVERSVLLERPSVFGTWREHVEAGADHVIFGIACRSDLDAVAGVVGELSGERCL